MNNDYWMKYLLDCKGYHFNSSCRSTLNTRTLRVWGLYIKSPEISNIGQLCRQSDDRKHEQPVVLTISLLCVRPCITTIINSPASVVPIRLTSSMICGVHNRTSTLLVAYTFDSSIILISKPFPLQISTCAALPSQDH